MKLNFIEPWVAEILADPITKSPVKLDHFPKKNGILDARIFLKNSYGFKDWIDGQNSYEKWESEGTWYKNQFELYKNEIEYDSPIYSHFHILGDILDVGGGVGTVREFLDSAVTRHISIDPFIDAPYQIPPAKQKAYTCLNNEMNFISAMAEFLPFVSGSFDWVHMRSMLDHVQVPDLALLEAYRVLKIDGYLLVGISVEGGRTGRVIFSELLKEFSKNILSIIGINKFKDMHTWHPTYKNLLKIIESNGFMVRDVYWQPYWNDKVVYVLAQKQSLSSQSKEALKK